MMRGLGPEAYVEFDLVHRQRKAPNKTNRISNSPILQPKHK